MAQEQREQATADDLEWAVQYALMQGCFFPVPEVKPPYRVQDLRKWGAMRHLHDVIARYPFARNFNTSALPARGEE